LNIDEYAVKAKNTFAGYSDEIVKYVEYLYLISDNASVIDDATIDSEFWQPAPQKCHYNVDTYCSIHKEYRPARGWLFSDQGYHADYVTFLQHSVVRDENDLLVDITPRTISRRLPFIWVPDTDEKFFDMEKWLIDGSLFHLYRK
jgi:hypothetical protein